MDARKFVIYCSIHFSFVVSAIFGRLRFVYNISAAINFNKATMKNVLCPTCYNKLAAS